MKSNNFRRGFIKGFSAPFAFFSPSEIYRPLKKNGSVEKAWADTARLLLEATQEQGKHIERQKSAKQSQN